MSTPSQRIQHLSSQLSGAGDQKSRAKASLLAKNPNDVVITLAIRTPLTKAKKGLLKDTQLEGLLVPLLQTTVQKSGLAPELVEEIVLGNVLHKDAPYVLRASGLAAGFPATTAVSHVSRWCSSGLLAVESVAQKVALGSIDIGIAIGAESMSNNPDNGAPPLPAEFLAQPVINDLTQLMPWTSENVARDFCISRENQDGYAAASFQKAEAAQKAGYTADEIVPIATTWKDPKTGEVRKVIAEMDDGVRPGTTKEGLSKIRSAFPQWPPATTTGGNASQITDGAAAVLIMRRDVAEKLKQPIIGKFVLSTIAGLEPRIMGIGPTLAIPKLLGKLGITKDDVDIFEINEAFASMLVYCTEKLDIDPARLNPRGGAIAFGHPLGCTGARQVVTALSELKRTGGKIAVTSMCIGTGMGMASLLVAE
ncbi:3-ketoacyl-CoA thiolase [Plectosphaerella plurivora]|uniref:acetyl-CoA C-acyltransferase n=1 Tax=Plectosphaerella plurivora TaxID=936078 RepID=A0A9P8V6T8_9PEZI|nr:3-ketoacyl-CoA thiolase [Plectosphaerella plurivora]